MVIGDSKFFQIFPHRKNSAPFPRAVSSGEQLVATLKSETAKDNSDDKNEKRHNKQGRHQIVS